MEKCYHNFYERRKKLSDKVGVPVLLIGAFEQERIRFHQDSTFYYFTGVLEPGAFCFIDESGHATLYIPNFTVNRADWVPGSLKKDTEMAEHYGFSSIEYAGSAVKGYSVSPFFEKDSYATLVEVLKSFVASGQIIYAPLPSHIFDRLSEMVVGLKEIVKDISPLVAEMRRKKDQSEIAALYNAVEVTMVGQYAAAKAISEGQNECHVAASVDYVFTESHAKRAFPTIVGSGKNGAILHYTQNCKELKAGDLVVVDMGACVNHYCGDLTRTYPVSGVFTDRQKELYQIVLDTHEHVASYAKPGYWLRNNEHPEKSLHHIAVNFLKERGYDRYFIHGIGHFLGLDVHDVGDYKDSLQVGDVITIEPGIYIPEENIGIRLEDNYWIIEDGAMCLSEHLPKDIESIEKMVQENF